MANGPSYPSRLLFSRDLRAIREARNLPLELLHEETKIPLGVLQDFEETGLSDNPMFNRVYLRSLVRTYAIYVGIPSKAALEALDEALLDQYQGRLVAEYVEGATTERTASTPAKDDRAPEPVPTAREKEPGKTDEREEASPEAPKKASVGMGAAPSLPPEEAGLGAHMPVADVSEKGTLKVAPPAEQRARPSAAGEEPQEELLAEGGPPAEAATEKEPALREYVSGSTPGKSSPPLLTTAEAGWETRRTLGGVRHRKPVDVKKRASNTQWVFIVGTILTLAVAIWAVLAFLDRPPETEPALRVVVDSTNVVVPMAEPERPPIIVGDTLDVVVIAVTKVERIHIKRDEDTRRPYWIEEGVAKAYPTLDRIVLENRLDRIRLLVEGYEYPTDRRDEQGRIVITRDAVQAFVDTLTAAPVQLATAPDTISLVIRRAQ